MIAKEYTLRVSASGSKFLLNLQFFLNGGRPNDHFLLKSSTSIPRNIPYEFPLPTRKLSLNFWPVFCPFCLWNSKDSAFFPEKVSALLPAFFPEKHRKQTGNKAEIFSGKKAESFKFQGLTRKLQIYPVDIRRIYTGYRPHKRVVTRLIIRLYNPF